MKFDRRSKKFVAENFQKLSEMESKNARNWNNSHNVFFYRTLDVLRAHLDCRVYPWSNMPKEKVELNHALQKSRETFNKYAKRHNQRFPSMSIKLITIE